MKTHKEIIKEKLKGCGKETFHSEDGYDTKEFCGENGLCPTCKLFLSGFKTALENELEFLEEFAENLIVGKRKRGQHKYNKIDIKQRITDIKNALRLLENGGK